MSMDDYVTNLQHSYEWLIIPIYTDDKEYEYYHCLQKIAAARLG